MDPIDLPDPPLGTDRIVLRPPTPVDAHEVVTILQDPEIHRWTRVPSPYRRHHYDQFVTIARDGIASGTDVPFLVHARDDDHVIGAAGLHVVDERDLVAQIGYWCRTEDRGRGHITAAVGLIRDWAFATQAWERIEIHVGVGNDASIRVAEKAGFQREAVLRSRLGLRDGRADMVMLAQLRPPPAAP